MAESIDFLVNILSGSSPGLAAIGALKSLDDSAARASSGIQALESSVGSAQKKLETLTAGDNIKGIAMELADAKAKLDAIRSGKTPFDAGEYKRASDSVGKLGSQLDAAKTKNVAAIEAQKAKVESLTGKLNEQRAAQASNANLVSAKRALIKKGLDEQISGMGAILSKAKETGGPLGNLAGKLEGLGKGGAVGVAVAVAVALAAIAVGAVVAAVSLARYALAASDAARSSRLLSDAATGSSAGGKELETVVDQLSNKIPQARQKTAEWARELSLAEIKGRDMQRTLTTMGIVASAVGDSGAAKIKGIAEASRLASRLMLGARDRFGEFASLQGTGIKAADVYAALAKSMGKSIPEAERMVRAGIVPMKKGLEALELAAQTKFGPIVARQMMSLENQSTRLRENTAKLFSGANIEKFLAGLQTVTELFDTNTVMGYALREVFTAVFTKVAEISAKVFPYVRAAILGVAFGIILVATYAKRLYTALSTAFEGAGKNIDGISLAFQIGAGVVGLFVGSILGLAAAFVLLGTVAALATAPIWVPFAVAIAFIYLMATAIESVVDSVSSLADDISAIDLGDAAENLMDSLINGIEKKIAAVGEVMARVGAAITGSFDAKMEIASPSKAMTRRANFVVDPLVDVPNDRANEVRTAIGGLGNLDAPKQLGTGGDNGAPKGDIVFNDCTFGSGPAEDVRRIIREERDLFFMGVARGNAVTA